MLRMQHVRRHLSERERALMLVMLRVRARYQVNKTDRYLSHSQGHETTAAVRQWDSSPPPIQYRTRRAPCLFRPHLTVNATRASPWLGGGVKDNGAVAIRSGGMGRSGMEWSKHDSSGGVRSSLWLCVGRGLRGCSVSLRVTRTSRGFALGETGQCSLRAASVPPGSGFESECESRHFAP